MRTFQAFLQRPPQSTRDWACAQRLTNPTSAVYQEALKRDRQSWLLQEPCSWSALVVMRYAASKSGLYRLPAQGWDRGTEDGAERRLRGAVREPKSQGRRASRRRPAVDQAALAEREATELESLRAGVVHGAQLLYDGLPVHSLDEGELCTAVCEHLARPCIAKAPALLARLAGAAGVDLTALRRSVPALAQRLDCLAAVVQDAVSASRDYWEELSAVLVAQRAARPARARVVCRSQCLHRGRHKLLAQARQTQCPAYFT